MEVALWAIAAVLLVGLGIIGERLNRLRDDLTGIKKFLEIIEAHLGVLVIQVRGIEDAVKRAQNEEFADHDQAPR